ncbi:MAG: DUF1043 family protein [Pseudomonadota bacterium]
MAIEWIFLAGFGGFIVGVGATLLLARSGRMQKGRVQELQAELQAAQDELSDYKREVFGQFAETAEKFRNLDRSYAALHKQLATSSVALCGDQATPLLGQALSDEEAAAATDAEIVQEVPATEPSAASEDAADISEEIVVTEEGHAGESAPQPDADTKLEATETGLETVPDAIAPAPAEDKAESTTDKNAEEPAQKNVGNKLDDGALDKDPDGNKKAAPAA